MTNPYAPPVHVEPSGFRFTGWKRILLWAPLIFCTLMAVAMAYGLTMSNWQIYGERIEDAVANLRIIRQLTYAVVGVALYWRFASKTPHSRFLNVLALYAAVQVIDIIVAVVIFHAPADSLLDPWGTARSFSAAMVGLGLSFLRQRGPGLAEG